MVFSIQWLEHTENVKQINWYDLTNTNFNMKRHTDIYLPRMWNRETLCKTNKNITSCFICSILVHYWFTCWASAFKCRAMENMSIVPKKKCNHVLICEG